MTTASPSVPITMQEDGGLMHFLRFLLISIVMSALSIVLVGVIWRIISFSKVGYRKRDVLLLFIPVVNIIFSIKTMWRYTAKNVYWTPRDDRPSSSLFSGS